jgi:hypothetical protein
MLIGIIVTKIQKTNNMSFYDDDEDYYSPDRKYVSAHKAGKIANDPTKHYPNKDEAQELRKIMASTGLTEEEVRQDKKYRKMLSEAQKQGEVAKRSALTKWYHRMIKKACQQTQLAPQHPQTIEALQKILDNQDIPRRIRWSFHCSSNAYNKYSAKRAVEIYAK